MSGIKSLFKKAALLTLVGHPAVMVFGFAESIGVYTVNFGAEQPTNKKSAKLTKLERKGLACEQWICRVNAEALV